MSYDGRLLRLAQERYEADRSIREAEQAARREAIYTSRPRLREIDEELRRTASRVLAAALRRGQDPLPEIQRLKEQNLSLQEERKGLLAELGLTETALEETPLCPLCGDTGYRGGEICRCLKVYYVEEQRKELSKLLDLGSQSFDTCFFTVSGNKRDSTAFVNQFDCSFYLPFFHIKFFGYHLNNIHYSLLYHA